MPLIDMKFEEIDCNMQMYEHKNAPSKVVSAPYHLLISLSLRTQIRVLSVYV